MVVIESCAALHSLAASALRLSTWKKSSVNEFFPKIPTPEANLLVKVPQQKVTLVSLLEVFLMFSLVNFYSSLLNLKLYLLLFFSEGGWGRLLLVRRFLGALLCLHHLDSEIISSAIT